MYDLLFKFKKNSYRLNRYQVKIQIENLFDKTMKINILCWEFLKMNAVRRHICLTYISLLVSQVKI